MGKFKDQGDPVLALAEECAELIQVINKKYRFSGDSLNAWNEVPTGKTESRVESLLSEIADVQYQIARTLEAVRGEHDDYHDSGSNSHFNNHFDTRKVMSFFKGGNIEDNFQEEQYKDWEQDEDDCY
jgi:hypothetical protein